MILVWCAIAVGFIAVATAGVSRLNSRRNLAEKLNSVERLAQSAIHQRQIGAYGLAVVDLDSAIELLRAVDSSEAQARLVELKQLRKDAVTRDAESSLAALASNTDLDSVTGRWLTLQARISKDRDLANLKEKFEAEFKNSLENSVKFELAKAHSAFEAQNFDQSLAACLRIDRATKHMAPDIAAVWKARLEATVSSLVLARGVVLSVSEVDVLDQSARESYLPLLSEPTIKVLKHKGYLLAPPGEDWRGYWSHAPFRVALDVSEHREGNYQNTQNRLTRITLNLVLSYGSRRLWGTSTSSRSRVPLPGIPASFSNQLALSPARIDQLERLLYDDAKSVIGDRLSAILKDLPGCDSVSDKIDGSE